jgi:hypothetical protein
MKSFVFVALMTGLCQAFFPETLRGQACTASAMQWVYDAESKSAAGNNAEAANALEKAAGLCVNSCKILTAVGETYAKMGNLRRAARYVDDARSLGCVVSAGLARAAANAPPLVTPAPPPPTPAAGTSDVSFVRQKWALVVGIDRFLHAEVPPLHLSAKDARDFADTLLDPAVGRFQKETVTLLLNEEATVGRIKTEISKIARNARPDDLVVLYFSTHGSSKELDLATEQGKTGYIVAYDTDVQNLYATAFPMDELKRVVDWRFKAGRVVTFLDTCYSGDTVRDGGKGLTLGMIPEDSIAKVAQGKGRVVITSSRSTEQSWECEAYHNSCFTHELLQALREKNGLSTVTELYRQLQLKVPAVVLREKRRSQNPIMQPESGRVEIVIGTPID